MVDRRGRDKRPTIAATCGAHIPAALTTSSVSIRPSSVWTAVTAHRADRSKPVTRTPGPDAHPKRAGRVRDGIGRAMRVESPYR